MLLPAAKAAFAFSVALHSAAQAPQPPLAVPFDCSWIYHPPSGERQRFEGVYYSFIDNSGFVPCLSDSACKAWMGKASAEIDFSDRASAQLRRRYEDMYGIYRIVFDGRRGSLGTRPGCDDRWSAEAGDRDYVRVEKILGITRPDKRRP